jgi:hypothetical protein
MTRRKKESKSSPKKKPPQAPKFDPLPILQDEKASLDEEMEDLFEEDRVVHRHGSTEPERD